jgi:MFS family permease
VNAGFRALWASQTVSAAGSAVTLVALPLTAILGLEAGPAEMGVLVALQQAPVPLFGLFAGVWVDRVRRRPLMVAGQFGRALLLASIPLAATLDALSLAQLYAVAFGVGTLTVCFDLANTSYLPTVLPRPQLIRGNSRLILTDSLAQVGGRGLGGGLVQALGAPLAILFDVASYVASGFLLWRLPASEPHAESAVPSAGLWREIRDGTRAVFRQPVIASMVATSTVGALGGAVMQAALVLFMTQDLGLAPFWIGMVLALGSVAALPTAALTDACSRRFGPGPTLVLATAISTLGVAITPLAGGGALRVAMTLGAGQVLLGVGLTLYSITQISLRQAITPDHLLGRVNATRRVLVFGVIPIGALVGGAIGEAAGLRTTLWVAAGLNALSLCVAALSPLREARTLPAEALA